MRYLVFAVILAILTGCSGSNDVSLEVRLADTEPGDGLIAMPHKATGDTFYVEPEVILSNQDVARAEVMNMEGKPFIQINLNEEATDRFAIVTEENISRHAAIIIDGTLIMAPTIRTKIDRGMATIDGDFTMEEADRIVRGLDPEHN